MVAGEDEHVLRVILLDEADVLIDCVGRAAIPLAALGLHVRRQNEHAAAGEIQIPRSAVADVAVQLKGLILRQNADGIDVRIRAVGEGKVNDAELSTKGDGGFGHDLGQQAETAALASGQQHGDAFLFDHTIPAFSSYLRISLGKHTLAYIIQ